MKSPIYLLLLLGRLSENLPAHMEAWKRAAGAATSRGRTSCTPGDRHARPEKPYSLGFDRAIVTKIFDFNFAIGLPPTGLLYDRYGSPRYMALTVRLSRGYGAAADAHCFGVHLWDHCALETPFAAIAPRGIREGRLPWGPAVGQQPRRRECRPLHRAH